MPFCTVEKFLNTNPNLTAQHTNQETLELQKQSPPFPHNNLHPANGCEYAAPFLWFDLFRLQLSSPSSFILPLRAPPRWVLHFPLKMLLTCL